MLLNPGLFDHFRKDDIQAIVFGPTVSQEPWKNEHFEKMMGWTTLSDLKIIDTPLDRRTFKILDEIPSLTNLELDSCQLDESDILSLKRLYSLKRLSLKHVIPASQSEPNHNALKISAVLNALAKSQKIDVLVLNSNDLTDQDLALISKIKTLQELGLEYNPKITAAGLAPLSQLPQLSTLDIKGINLGPGAIPYLEKLQKLIHLRPGEQGWTDKQKNELIRAMPNCKDMAGDLERAEALKK
jgi:hypothetical protein